jgi:hypothetical protein
MMVERGLSVPLVFVLCRGRRRRVLAFDRGSALKGSISAFTRSGLWSCVSETYWRAAYFLDRFSTWLRLKTAPRLRSLLWSSCRFAHRSPRVHLTFRTLTVFGSALSIAIKATVTVTFLCAPDVNA